MVITWSTNEAVKHKIGYLIGDYEPLREWLDGGNVNGLTIQHLNKEVRFACT